MPSRPRVTRVDRSRRHDSINDDYDDGDYSNDDDSDDDDDEDYSDNYFSDDDNETPAAANEDNVMVLDNDGLEPHRKRVKMTFMNTKGTGVQTSDSEEQEEKALEEVLNDAAAIHRIALARPYCTRKRQRFYERATKASILVTIDEPDPLAFLTDVPESFQSSAHGETRDFPSMIDNIECLQSRSHTLSHAIR